MEDGGFIDLELTLLSVSPAGHMKHLNTYFNSYLNEINQHPKFLIIILDSTFASQPDGPGFEPWLDAWFTCCFNIVSGSIELYVLMK